MSSIDKIKYIGEERKKKLLKLGVKTAEDLLYLFPRAYEDRTVFKKISEITPGETVCVVATVAEQLSQARIRKNLVILKGRIFDQSGSMEIVVFNQIYLKTRLKEGETFIFYGKVFGNLLKKEFINPQIDSYLDNQDNKKILSIYPLVSGLSQNLLRKIIKQAANDYLKNIVDPLPFDVILKNNLCDIKYALYNIHFPKDEKAQKKAKERLIFDELFYLFIGMQFFKKSQRTAPGCKMNSFVNMDAFYDSLEYTLTNAQKRAINDCLSDMSGALSMNRLLQGDVGSGKTVVAAAMIYFCVKNNYQAAFMVPTEILANQHYSILSELFDKFKIRARLLTSSVSANKKREIKSQIENGEIDVVIGTHALISSDVRFKNLGLCVVDEQHRFGVQQRANLSAKGDNPHVLVMSATPIPRTLALIIYADLDISIIDEKPLGRKNVETFLVNESMEPRIYDFIKKQAAMGLGAYFVCPAIEDEDGGKASVLKLSKELQSKHLKGLKIGAIHGKMSFLEKAGVMDRFLKKQIQVLVSTTVIEVGIDVKSANVMVIKDAQQFGLSQLHQLRGRVGRGDEKSYCILISNSKNQEAIQRLKTLTSTGDGFLIAEYDLKFRGAGEFLGNRQHGLPVLKIASLAKDMQILTRARDAALETIYKDDELKKQENFLLKQKINKLFYDVSNKNIFN